MKIAISGVTGFVGSELQKVFSSKKHNVIALTRNCFTGDPEVLAEMLNDCEVVINLAGAPINRRWSERYKKELYKSRIDVTRKLVVAINSLNKKPKLLISASAVGYYPSEGSFDEYNSRAGEGFLAHLCVDWEKESQNLSSEVRLVNSRFGVILSAKGGAFEKMMLPTKFKLATSMGRGLQAFPWISLVDLVRAIEFIIENPSIKGAVNFTAPQQITNLEFTQCMARHLGTWLRIRIPAFFLKIIMGEASSFLLEGQNVQPTKLLEAGFTFYDSNIDSFIGRLSN